MAKKNLINADMLLASPKPQPPLSTPPPTAPDNPPPPVVVAVEAPPSPVAADTPAPTATQSVKKGLKADETRATFILNEILVEKLKAVAYWDRRNIKEVMNEALERYIGAYEKQNGPIQPLP